MKKISGGVTAPKGFTAGGVYDSDGRRQVQIEFVLAELFLHRVCRGRVGYAHTFFQRRVYLFAFLVVRFQEDGTQRG